MPVNTTPAKKIILPFIVWNLICFAFLSYVLNQSRNNWTLSLIESATSIALVFTIGALTANVFSYYLPRKKRILFVLAMSAIGGVIGSLLFNIIWPVLEKFCPTPVYAIDPLLNNLIRGIVYFFIIGVMALYKMFEMLQWEQVQSQLRKNESETLKRDAELYKLKYQLQPHFLFNSLNSINALISSRPEQAKQMVQQLSDFLRGTLKSEENALVPLQAELEQVNLYLAIEKVRFGHRLITSFDLDEQCKTHTIPAMLLQPVLENAIKFGLYHTSGEVEIKVTCSCNEEGLHITISNPFDEDAAPAVSGTGFGLRAIQRRLYLIYGRSDLLTTNADNTIFTTKILIP